MLASFFFRFNNCGIKIFTSWPNPQVITLNNTTDDTFWTGIIRWCQLFFLLQTIHPRGGLTSDQGQLSVLCSLSLWCPCAGSVAGPQRRSGVHRSTCTQEDGQQREGRSPGSGTRRRVTGLGSDGIHTRGCWNRYCHWGGRWGLLHSSCWARLHEAGEDAKSVITFPCLIQRW